MMDKTKTQQWVFIVFLFLHNDTSLKWCGAETSINTQVYLISELSKRTAKCYCANVVQNAMLALPSLLKPKHKCHHLFQLISLHKDLIFIFGVNYSFHVRESESKIELWIYYSFETFNILWWIPGKLVNFSLLCTILKTNILFTILKTAILRANQQWQDKIPIFPIHIEIR